MKEPTNRWQRLKDVFNEVDDLEPDSRQKYLSELRINEKTFYQELSELLEAEKDSAEFLQNPIVFESDYSFVGKTVGHYKIIGEIGRGGMGAVFEAVREDGEFEQKAAIKLTNRNLFSNELVKRFRTERQILAKLEHANIVRLLDGGITSEHIPYFVMEFVEGVPITGFCAKNNLAVNERLALFLQVCEAVAYAHRQFIVHRDLKPSNILVTADGQVKLLDFGIAKILDSDEQTQTANTPLTPEYASPEQIKGEIITTASDVYSLGVILFELLTGREVCKIYSVKRADLLRGICESEPVRPSSVVNSGFQVSITKSENETSSINEQKTNPRSKIQNPKFLKGDLDNIILKSLQKEKEQRYVSVEQFADDVRAYLQGLPVKAHPQSFTYRTQKFVNRNRFAVSIAAVSILLILAGAAISIWQSVVARHQREIAEHNFNQVRKIANSLILDYHDEIAKLEGSTKLREKLVADALNYLDTISAEETGNAELLKEMATAYRKIADVQGMPYAANLGKADDAAINYRKSIELLEKALKLDPQSNSIKDELVKSYYNLAQINTRLGVRSDEILQKALAMSDELAKLDENNLERKISWFKLRMGNVGTFSSSFSTRVSEFKKIIDDAQSFYDKNPQNVDLVAILAMTTERLGSLYRWEANDQRIAGNPEEARINYTESLKYARLSLEYMKHRQALEPDDLRNKRRLFVANSNLSTVLICLEQTDEAEKHRQTAEFLIKDLLRTDPNNKEAVLDEIAVLRDKYLISTKKNDLLLAYQTAKNALEIAKTSYQNDPTNSEPEVWVGYFYSKLIDNLESRKKEKELEVYRKDFNEFKRKYEEKHNGVFNADKTGL